MTGREIRVRGQVQGVGFRPFVWHLARSLGLTGEVRNDAEGVLIHVSGHGLDAFETALRTKAPPLARIHTVESKPADLPSRADFTIAASGPQGGETAVTPDAALCDNCRREIDDPTSRRHGYAFANCTACGPRFSILTGLPYDRAQTTMAAFPICPACRAEYDTPSDRRFHAEPIACPSCGPRLWLEVGGKEQPGDPIAQATAILKAGGIVALKGLGGFHLACLACDAAAVDRLRTRKQRPAKPFALMAPLDGIPGVTPEAAQRLTDSAAPIVLLPAAEMPETIAPGLTLHGWMLPHSPLHHLICRAVGEPLVMTSGNRSGRPQAVDNDTARRELGPLTEAILLHDRAIARRLDDGVERITGSGPMTLRRGRGQAPATLPIPFADAPQVVAYGGQMKGAICLVKNGRALLSHHLGDLDNPETRAAFAQADRDYASLFHHHPQIVAVDLHPDFHATRHGQARAEAEGLALTHVQHHHAHMAAALGEAMWQGTCAVGIVLDGLGLGPDGTIWGGEVLLGDYAHVTRAGGLTPAPLIGGDRAQMEPWRNAVARLDAAGLSAAADRLFATHPVQALRKAAALAPQSTSAGRLFDAVAACLGMVPDRQTYEGEAAMRLEALASKTTGSHAYPLEERESQIDPSPLFRALIRDLDAGTDPAVIAFRFHAGLATAFAALAARIAWQAGTRTIALSGGCFQNALLLDLTAKALDGFDLCIPRQVPPNDGGLAFGQALVAIARAQHA